MEPSGPGQNYCSRCNSYTWWRWAKALKSNYYWLKDRPLNTRMVRVLKCNSCGNSFEKED